MAGAPDRPPLSSGDLRERPLLTATGPAVGREPHHHHAATDVGKRGPWLGTLSALRSRKARHPELMLGSKKLGHSQVGASGDAPTSLHPPGLTASRGVARITRYWRPGSSL